MEAYLILPRAVVRKFHEPAGFRSGHRLAHSMASEQLPQTGAGSFR